MILNKKDEIKELLKKADGWLSIKEAMFLYDTVLNSKDNVIEIGSWKGKSTIIMAKAIEKRDSKIKNKIYAIDPHTGSKEHQKDKKINTFYTFLDNIIKANVREFIFPIVKTSVIAEKSFNETFDFIFIDGSHEYKDVKKDFEICFPKLKVGGIIAMHDTNGWYGPKKVAEKYLYKSKIIKNANFIDSISYGKNKI